MVKVVIEDGSLNSPLPGYKDRLLSGAIPESGISSFREQMVVILGNEDTGITDYVRLYDQHRQLLNYVTPTELGIYCMSQAMALDMVDGNEEPGSYLHTQKAYAAFRSLVTLKVFDEAAKVLGYQQLDGLNRQTARLVLLETDQSRLSRAKAWRNAWGVATPVTDEEQRIKCQVSDRFLSDFYRRLDEMGPNINVLAGKYQSSLLSGQTLASESTPQDFSLAMGVPERAVIHLLASPDLHFLNTPLGQIRSDIAQFIDLFQVVPIQALIAHPGLVTKETASTILDLLRPRLTSRSQVEKMVALLQKGPFSEFAALLAYVDYDSVGYVMPEDLQRYILELNLEVYRDIVLPMRDFWQIPQIYLEGLSSIPLLDEVARRSAEDGNLAQLRSDLLLRAQDIFRVADDLVMLVSNDPQHRPLNEDQVAEVMIKVYRRRHSQ